jgi:transposase
MTLVCDAAQGTVEYVGEGRNEESLGGYFEAFTAEQLAAIEAISMDMWQPYINATEHAVPGAAVKIVFDRFHIMQHALDAVDRVRKTENRALRAEGDDSLVGTKYQWLRSAYHLAADVTETFLALKDSVLKTARAWALKESLRALWTYRTRGWAERFWRRWYFWATHSRLAPMIKVARMIQRRLSNVLTYFKHRITNAVAEGINSKIAAIQKRACGFRNRDHFKIAVYFHCGGLSLYPSKLTPGIAG